MTATLRISSAALAFSAMLAAGPLFASAADADGATSHTQSSWHTNMHDRSGTLVGLSPVAAKIRFGDGASRIFSISHGSYERLRSYVGDVVSFDVRHDVLHVNS